MRKLLILSLAFSMPTFADTIYQCRDAKGKVTLQDAPCAGSATDRIVRSGQDASREKYLAAGGDPYQAYARGVMYGATCRIAQDAYRAARAAADAAAARGDVGQMQEANARVDQAGRRIAEQGC